MDPNLKGCGNIFVAYKELQAVVDRTLGCEDSRRSNAVENQVAPGHS